MEAEWVSPSIRDIPPAFFLNNLIEPTRLLSGPSKQFQHRGFKIMHSSNYGVGISWFGDSCPGQRTSGCKRLKMFAKAPGTPTVPLILSQSFLEKEAFVRNSQRLCYASTSLFPGHSRLYAQTPCCCSDPVLGVPVCLVTSLALVLTPSCPVSLLTLSCSMCQTFCLGWTLG